jgi:chromosome segregation ATPase
MEQEIEIKKELLRSLSLDIKEAASVLSANLKEIEDAKAILSTLKAQVTVKSDELSKTKLQIINANERLNFLYSKQADADKFFEHKVEEKTAELKSIEDNISALKVKEHDIELSIDDLAATRQMSSNELASLEDKLSSIKSQILDSERELSRVQSEIESSDRMQEDNRNKHNAEVIAMQNEIDELEAELEAKRQGFETQKEYYAREHERLAEHERNATIIWTRARTAMQELGYNVGENGI